MKRLFITIIIVFAGYHHDCPAQLIKSYGVKVALTSANDNYENKNAPDVSTKRRIGFNIGGFVEWFHVPYFSAITQIEYVQKGSGMDFDRRDEHNNDLGTITYYGRLDYISIPILAKFSIPTASVSPFLLMGPRFDFLVGYQSDKNIFNDLYSKIKINVTGASIGIGAQIKLILETNIMAEIRYNYDFVDSFKNDIVRTRNDSYDIWIGLSF